VAQSLKRGRNVRACLCLFGPRKNLFVVPSHGPLSASSLVWSGDAAEEMWQCWSAEESRGGVAICGGPPRRLTHPRTLEARKIGNVRKW